MIPDMESKLHIFLLPLVLLIGFVLRIKSIWFGYPLMTYTDEQFLINPAWNMLPPNFDLNPHHFMYPSLIIYLQVPIMTFVATYNYILFGIPPHDIPRVDFHIAGRAVAAIASTASIFVTYVIGRKLFDIKVGLFAAGILAVSPVHISNSALVTTDIWVAIFSTLILFYCTKIYNEAHGKDYILAGLFLGLAAGSKYTAIVLCFAIVLAHLMSKPFALGNIFERNLFIVAASSATAFLATTPYAILDAKKFLEALAWQRRSSIEGRLGEAAAGDTSYEMYANILFSNDVLGWLGMTLALVGILFALKRGYRPILFVLAMPVALFLFLGYYKSFAARQIVGAVPALTIAAAFAVYAILNTLTYLRDKEIAKNSLYLFVFLAIASPLAFKAIDDVKERGLTDTRWISLNWVKGNLPVGSTIAVENHAPPPDQLSPRFNVVELGVLGLIRNKDKIDSTVDFIILSSLCYGRLFDATGKAIERYKEYAQVYSDFFNAYKLVYEFSPQPNISTGPIIRIYENVTALKNS